MTFIDNPVLGATLEACVESVRHGWRPLQIPNHARVDPGAVPFVLQCTNVVGNRDHVVGVERSPACRRIEVTEDPIVRREFSIKDDRVFRPDTASLEREMYRRRRLGF